MERLCCAIRVGALYNHMDCLKVEERGRSIENQKEGSWRTTQPDMFLALQAEEGARVQGAAVSLEAGKGKEWTLP